ncbi:MAG: discoidin domain-containing protein, partial [Planctomycetota bacterium]
MKRVPRLFVAMFLLAPALLVTSVRPIRAAGPENLAPKARTSASSEHNALYQAKFAVDGKIPPAGGQGVDRGTAWCVLKANSGDRADFTFEWGRPVEVAEIVYFGRTAWFMTECWKDFEVYLDRAEKPAAKGTFKMIHSPQRIKLPKTEVRKITIKFLNSYGGPNPGAAEMMVFANSPAKKDLAEMVKLATLKGAPTAPQYAAAQSPKVDQVDRERLRALIGQLMRLHGRRYAKGPEHLARLDTLADDSDEDDSDELVELQ